MAKRRRLRKHRKHFGRNRHHLTPKSRGGRSTPDNIIWLDIERHDCWHKIFGLRTLSEAIDVLQRLQKIKGGRFEKTHKNYKRQTSSCLGDNEFNIDRSDWLDEDPWW